MAWWKKSEKENPESGAGSLEEAAARVTAPEPTPEPPAVAPAEESPAAIAPFVLKPEWARAAVKVSFYPLCRFNHRAWCLTDEEAERARPQMQAFLQAVGGRYLPQLVSRFITEAGTKFPELLELAAAMAALAWFKYRQVQEAVEAEPAGPVPVPRAVVRPGTAEKQSEDDIQCEVCGLWFENRAYLVLHLPCPGRTQ